MPEKNQDGLRQNKEMAELSYDKKIECISQEMKSVLENYISEGWKKSLSLVYRYLEVLDDDSAKAAANKMRGMLSADTWDEIFGCTENKKIHIYESDALSEAAHALNFCGYNSPELMEEISSFNINRADFKKAYEKVIETNPLLALAMEEGKFRFCDLAKIEGKTLQKILRSCDDLLLSQALAHESKEFLDKIYSCMSKNKARSVQENISAFAGLPDSKIYDAQEKICEIVSELNKNFEIFIFDDHDD